MSDAEEAPKVRRWELAPKVEVPAIKLVHHESDQMGRFMVALSLAFNDLKGMVLFEQYLLSIGRPGPDDWSANAGQWRGAAGQIHRWIAGILYEVMKLIAKNKMLLRSKELLGLVATLPDDTQQAWNDLTTAALDTSGKMSSLLLRIRNSAAFHYDQKSLGDGFKKQFIVDAAAKSTEANRSAQYSYGPDMDGTRFYYADAAAQQTLMKLGLQFGAPETDRTLVELGGSLN